MITNNARSLTRFAVLFGVLCFSATISAAPIKVVLEVDTSGAFPVLKAQAGGNTSQCAAGPDDCVDVPKGRTPFIIFKLPHACDGTANDPQYRLTGMRITQVDKVWPSSGNSLNSTVATDFGASRFTGKIQFAAGNKTDRKLKFKNRNSHAYTVFYEITASHCTLPDEDDLHLDPEIRNRG
jgi:hypothetical protein